jgi:hypothetical protein
MAEMLTYLAGVAHRPGASGRLAKLIPGEELSLRPEPTNAYDKNAVAVHDGTCTWATSQRQMPRRSPRPSKRECLYGHDTWASPRQQQ